MKLSARNQLPGAVVSIAKGPVSSMVKIDIGGGVIVTSAVTTETVEELGLAVGDKVASVIKASDVLIGK